MAHQRQQKHIVGVGIAEDSDPANGAIVEPRPNIIVRLAPSALRWMPVMLRRSVQPRQNAALVRRRRNNHLVIPAKLSHQVIVRMPLVRSVVTVNVLPLVSVIAVP